MSRTADHAEHALPMTPAILFPAAVTTLLESRTTGTPVGRCAPNSDCSSGMREARAEAVLRRRRGDQELLSREVRFPAEQNVPRHGRNRDLPDRLPAGRGDDRDSHVPGGLLHDGLTTTAEHNVQAELAR